MIRGIVFVMLFFSSTLFGIDVTMLTKEKQELLEQKRLAIESGYKRLKYDYIGDLSLNGSASESRGANSDKQRYSSSASVGFKQDLFRSGGIESSIEYAENWYKASLIELEKEKNGYLSELATAKLEYEIERLKLKQSEYKLKNSQISLLIKEHQYSVGESDITLLNDAIRERNLSQKQLLSSKNTLDLKRFNLARVSSIEPDSIDTPYYEELTFERFIEFHLDLELAKYSSKMSMIEYDLSKSNYLPTLSFSANYGVQKNENVRGDDYYNYGLNLSMPLSYKTGYVLDEKKAQALRASIAIADAKIALENEYKSQNSSLETLRESIEILKDNIVLYDKLISITRPSVNAGERTKYDLSILENTKASDELEIEQNSLQLQLVFLKLFYAIKGER